MNASSSTFSDGVDEEDVVVSVCFGFSGFVASGGDPD